MPNQLDPFNNTLPQLESVKAYGWQTAKLIVSGSAHIRFLACPVQVVLASSYLSLGQITLDPSDQSADWSGPCSGLKVHGVGEVCVAHHCMMQMDICTVPQCFYPLLSCSCLEQPCWWGWGSGDSCSWMQWQWPQPASCTAETSEIMWPPKGTVRNPDGEGVNAPSRFIPLVTRWRQSCQQWYLLPN